MISLHSARMKCSLSGVRMQSEFFWPVLDSPSMTSEHWFILIVPWGRVVGCKSQRRTHKVVNTEVNRRAHVSLQEVLLTQSALATINATLGKPRADITVCVQMNVPVRTHTDIFPACGVHCSISQTVITELNYLRSFLLHQLNCVTNK